MNKKATENLIIRTSVKPSSEATPIKLKKVNIPNAETIAVLEEPRSAKVGPFATLESLFSYLDD
jgi:hypothetical protein